MVLNIEPPTVRKWSQYLARGERSVSSVSSTRREKAGWGGPDTHGTGEGMTGYGYASRPVSGDSPPGIYVFCEA
jgi:hypothetical protein